MNAVLAAARIQLVSWQWLLFPWFVTALAFGVNVALSTSMGDGFVSGGLSIVFVFAVISSVQTILQWFPFAAGLGISRHRFYLAALVVALGLAALSSLAILALSAVEDATGGWGSSLRFFGVAGLVVGSWPGQWAVYASLFVLAWTAGLLAGALAKRWGSVGVLSLVAAGVLVPATAAALLSATGSWGALDGWVTGQPPLTLLAALPALTAVLVATGGWLTLRRAAP